MLYVIRGKEPISRWTILTSIVWRLTWTAPLRSLSTTEMSRHNQVKKNICLVSSSLNFFSVVKRYLELNRFSGSKFPMLKDEIKYYSERYKRAGEDIQEVCQENSEVSADKKFVSKIWKDIPTALNEMTAEYIIHLMKLKYS